MIFFIDSCSELSFNQGTAHINLNGEANDAGANARTCNNHQKEGGAKGVPIIG
jgi:hypothetical protein